MNSEKYWAKRAEEREAAWNRKCRETVEKELARYYQDSLEKIQNDMAALYGRYANENKLSMADVRKLIAGSEYKTWRMSLEEYVAKIKTSKDEGLLRELNTLAMRSRISRLDKLYGDTLKELDKLGRSANGAMDEFLGGAYKDNYYQGLFEIGRKIGFPNTGVQVKVLSGTLI